MQLVCMLGTSSITLRYVTNQLTSSKTASQHNLAKSNQLSPTHTSSHHYGKPFGSKFLIFFIVGNISDQWAAASMVSHEMANLLMSCLVNLAEKHS